MIKKIHHIGIVVKNVDDAVKTYTKLLGKAPESRGALPGGKIKVANFRAGETALEFLEGAEGTMMADFIAKRGEGLHHIAVEVDDIAAELNKMTSSGIKGDKEPRQGPDGKIAFVGPDGSHGVTIELVEPAKKK
ncbi:MAG TPA: VOC family protein [Dehalococcoidales bacterium]|nr:VOC family protein [Dehalococcoidales bacterium]